MNNYKGYGSLSEAELLFVIDFLAEWDGDLLKELAERFPEIFPKDDWEDINWENEVSILMEKSKEEIEKLTNVEKANLVRDYLPTIYRKMIEEPEREYKYFLHDSPQYEAVVNTILFMTGEESGVVIDTETTGLDPEQDELLQVSIIDKNGRELFNSYFKPSATSWEAAERVNGISPEMVASCPTISEKMEEINAIMQHAKEVIGYNTQFDLRFLCKSGLVLSGSPEVVDVMEQFAPVYGEWNEDYECYKWQKLTTAANHFGYDWNSRPEGAHNSLADCYATLFVYNKLEELKDKKIEEEIHHVKKKRKVSR